MKSSLVSRFLCLVSIANGQTIIRTNFDGTPNPSGDCITGTGAKYDEIVDACVSNGLNCCTGSYDSFGCYWPPQYAITVTMCRNSCNSSPTDGHGCPWNTAAINGMTNAKIGPNSCNGHQACERLTGDTDLTVGRNSCNGRNACQYVGEVGDCVDSCPANTVCPGTCPPTHTNQCDSKSYCVNFDSIVSSLDGSTTTSDISVIYDASAPTTETSYKVTIMKPNPSDNTKCDTPLDDAATAGVAEAGTNPGDGISHANFGKGYDQLKVLLDIDTAKIEAGELTPSDASTLNSYDLVFCAKVDLVYESTDIAATEVSTSKTIFTMSITKEKGFDFTISAQQEATLAKAETVTVNYPLQACVCAMGTDALTDTAVSGVVDCLPSYTAMTPGTPFKFCIQAVTKDPQDVITGPSNEVSVDGLRDVSFQNDYNGDNTVDISVPIIDSDGQKVGPASITCATTIPGVCEVSAVTFAKMYEADTNEDNVFDNISGTNKVAGTATLAFKRRRLDGSIEEQLVDVPFGAAGSAAGVAATRVLQQAQDATPVNEFDMAVDLASPPGRSAATTASSNMAYASLMVGGLVGIVMF